MEQKNEILLTQEGYNKLEEEVEFLKTVRRKEVAERIKVAISFGDLSENAEYDAARNDQAVVENKIKELEISIENAKIISEVSTDKVTIGNNVKLEYVEDGEVEVYSIVGSKEADPFLNKISNESPIAKAILGLSVGNIAAVESPNGKYNVKIVEIF